MREAIVIATAYPGSTSIWKAMLALVLALGVFIALTCDPAAAQTTFIVNKTGDGGDRKLSDTKCDSNKRKNGKQCTLRAAIEEANNTTGADTIEFDIGSTNSVKTIAPDSELPTIEEAVTIDGYTQRGAHEYTLVEGNDAVLKVELDGTNAGPARGLSIDAASTVRGLVINRFDVGGISLGGGSGSRVEGNFIGTNASGTTALGNGSTGVSISGLSSGNTIGGTQPAQRNLISGNGNGGVGVAGASTGNSIQGNLIGTTADGTGDLGNSQAGVRIFGSDNTVGGTAVTARNVISGNDGYGVEINGTGATGNSVLSNSIFSNGGLGIDLSGGTEDANSVTANDTDDPDTGSNNLQNFPVIGTATKNSTTGVTTIPGTLNSNPSQIYIIQCFLTGGPGPSGHGEGAILLDMVVATTDADGDGSFTCESSLPVLGQLPDPKVSATATNTATDDTSEFSASKSL